MAETVNVRDTRVQYLTLDESPSKLRDARVQLLEEGSQAGAIRRLHGQVLVAAKDPAMVRDARAQFLAESSNPAAFRRMMAQVLIRNRNPINIKHTRLQYLEIDNAHPDFRLDAWTRLLKIANDTNGWNFTSDQIIPGKPEVSTVPGMWNTRLKITAQPSTGFSGSMYLHYQRYPINIRFKEIGHPFLNLTGKSTVKDVLADLNSWFNMSLTLNDVEDSPIVDGKFTLTVKDGSWYFLPGTSYKFVNLPDLTTRYPNTRLNGFEGSVTVGGVQAAAGSPSGIYPVMMDDQTFVNAYVDMETDGGFWIQVADWNTPLPAGAGLAFSDLVRLGDKFKGYTANSVTSPAVPAGRLTNNSTEWMFKSELAGWISLFGTYQIGKPFDADRQQVGPSETIPVRTSIGNKVLYAPRAGWGENTVMTHPFGFWTTSGNNGPCGGAGRVGPNKVCPIAAEGTAWSSHCDLSARKRFFVRASNYIPK